MPRVPEDSDPDGVETMSKRELQDRLRTQSSEALGLPLPGTDDPNGVVPPPLSGQRPSAGQSR